MVVLASASPRRRELLSLILSDFEVVTSGVDEHSSLTDPSGLVMELAERKAADIYKLRPGDVVVGADTAVYAGGRVLGKPDGRAEAKEMIMLLQGDTHNVYTGVCVISGSGKTVDCCSTRVTFSPMDEYEIEKYLLKEDYVDKAGAYAIQGGAAPYIKKIDGCYFNVVGLPVNRLYSILKRHTTLV